MSSEVCQRGEHKKCHGPVYGCGCDCHLRTKKGLRAYVRYLGIIVREMEEAVRA